jgi:hypothetical protein
VKEIAILEVLYNYVFTVKDDGGLAFHHEGEPPTEAERAKIAKLLDVVREHKAEAVQFLKTRRGVEDVFPFLLEAAEDCVRAARAAEKRGDLAEAQRLWKRYAELWTVIEPAPTIPWNEFPWNEFIQL